MYPTLFHLSYKNTKTEIHYIPQLSKLLQHKVIKQYESIYNKYLLHQKLKDFVNLYRKGTYTLNSKNKNDAVNEIAQNFSKEWDNIVRTKFRKVYNATGTILHTNLGRAPLPSEISNIFTQLQESYTNLEIDEQTHKRIKRERFVVEKITILTGTQFAVFVNNNAAAIFLLLKTLAENKEVIVSRSELIEIGEGFRLPLIMKESGTRLIEVGTSNRTYLSDYEQAITPQTALILKIHRSNFYQKGFTNEVSIEQLSHLSQKYKIPLIYDIGSGLLYNLDSMELKEPSVCEAIKSGADIVSFSCDKLLGGPQAGVLVGNNDILEKVRKHPLYRTYRLDKISLAILEKILSLYFLKEDKIIEIIPHFKLINENNETYIEKLHPYIVKLPKSIKCSWVKKTLKIGGGAAPSYRKKTFFLQIKVDSYNLSKVLNAIKNFENKIFFKIKEGTIYLHINYLNIEIVCKLLEHLSNFNLL